MTPASSHRTFDPLTGETISPDDLPRRPLVSLGPTDPVQIAVDEGVADEGEGELEVAESSDEEGNKDELERLLKDKAALVAVGGDEKEEDGDDYVSPFLAKLQAARSVKDRVSEIAYLQALRADRALDRFLGLIASKSSEVQLQQVSRC